jgi:hypothetical protein
LQAAQTRQARKICGGVLNSLRIKRKNFSKNIKKYFCHAAGCFNLGGLKPLFAIFKDMLRSGKKSL